MKNENKSKGKPKDKPQPKQSTATTSGKDQASTCISNAYTSQPVDQVNQGASNSDVPLPSPPTPLSREDSLKERFLVSPSDDFTTAIEAFHAITKDQPSLNVNPKPLQSGDLVVQPLDTTSLQILQSVAVLGNGKIVNLAPFNPTQKTKIVLEGYPLSFDIDWLLQHPSVETATRMKVRFSKEETRQILISYLGEPPEYLRTTTGTFTLCKYYPEPLRCTKCQRFDHHVTKCRFRPRCGLLRTTSQRYTFKT